MPDDPKAFHGLVSALGLMVVVIALTAVAIVVGVGTGSTLSGVLAWVALMLLLGVCIAKAPD